MLNARTTVLVSVLTGVALELGVAGLTGRREAWDSTQYWAVGLPIAAVVSMAIGYFSKQYAWLWTVLLIPAQVFTMMVRSGEVSGLLPLAVVLSVILSVPFVLLAFIASRVRRLSFSS